MRILLHLSDFSGPGGAEKVVSLMANYFANFHEVILLTDTDIHHSFFNLDSRVIRKSTEYSICNRSTLGQLFGYIKGLYTFRKIIKDLNPDVIISHIDMANIRILLATMGVKIPIIVEDHNNPNLKKLKQPWSIIKSFIYLRADAIVLLTKDLLKFYPKYFYKNISFIQNPLDIPTAISDSLEVSLIKPTFVALGSLTEQKGLDFLLEAFSIFIKTNPTWNLTLLGGGPLKESILQHAKELNIENRVHLVGRVTKPYPVLKSADIYVMSSRYEGFPVALCEAMGVGLPCISFDCPTGPADIIEHEVNGLLVDYLNIEKLAEAMIVLANDKEKRDKFSKESIKINNKLDINTIMTKWEVLIDKVSKCVV